MSALEIVYAPGVMPGKWLQRFTDTHPESELDARPLPEGEDPLEAVAAGRARFAFVRYPEGQSPASDTVHLIELYTERAVLCFPKDHEAEYFEENQVIPAEQAAAWPRLDPADFPPSAGGAAMMLEVVASGAGSVALLPQPVARLHDRKDTFWRIVEGEPTTSVGLAWARLVPAVADEDQPAAVAALADPLVEEFIGVVRGRRAGSSRQPSVREREQAEAKVRRRERFVPTASAPKAKKAEPKPESSAADNEQGDAKTGKHAGWAKAKTPQVKPGRGGGKASFKTAAPGSKGGKRKRRDKSGGHGKR